MHDVRNSDYAEASKYAKVKTERERERERERKKEGYLINARPTR
jgi:hypothetical protein